MFARSIVVASAVAFVAGQSGLSLTAPCTSALTGLVSNPEVSACLNPAALLQLAGATNSSIIAPINNWLTGMCGAPACSNATLTSVITNVTSGCSAELNTVLGTTSEPSFIPVLTQYVLEGYPTVRQLACLKDGSDFCVTKTLTTLEASWGTLSINGIVGLASSDASSNLTVPTEVTCSNCAKAAYTIVNREFPALVGDISQGASEQCGASFTDGQTPSGISLSASTSSSSPSNNNNSASRSMGGVAGIAAAALVVISTGFAVLV